eukprot:Sdes_comp19363_c0_seq1m10607
MASVFPGDRLGSIDEFQVGEGTFLRGNDIFASLVGETCIQKSSTFTNQKDEKSVISVRKAPNGSKTFQPENLVPKIGSIVTCKVKSLSSKFAKVDIICIKASKTTPVSSSSKQEPPKDAQETYFQPLRETFQGMIRIQDVQTSFKETLSGNMCDFFRPGDIVFAQVISLGDSHSYFCSTAKNELGVVHAISLQSGMPMKPLHWNEMICPKTNVIEKRKVAKLLDS